MAATDRTLDECVQALPPEIFDNIFDLVFTHNGCFTITGSSKPPAQLQVDRRSREAFAKVYYRQVTFVLPSKPKELGETTDKGEDATKEAEKAAEQAEGHTKDVAEPTERVGTNSKKSKTPLIWLSRLPAHHRDLVKHIKLEYDLRGTRPVDCEDNYNWPEAWSQANLRVEQLTVGLQEAELLPKSLEFISCNFLEWQWSGKVIEKWTNRDIPCTGMCGHSRLRPGESFWGAPGTDADTEDEMDSNGNPIGTSDEEEDDDDD